MRPLSYYTHLRETMEVHWTEQLDNALEKINGVWNQYTDPDFAPVPPAWLAAIHMMEGNNNMGKQILNGQRWDEKTTIHPVGLGPFKNWKESTMLAIELHKLRQDPDWTIDEALLRLEQWNGWGYAKRGKHSPYLWSGTNHGVGTGKFVADGKYDPNAMSKQLGAAPVLIALWDKEVQPAKWIYDATGEYKDGPKSQYQHVTLKAHGGYTGKIDGWLGPKSSEAHKRLFGHYLVGDQREEQ